MGWVVAVIGLLALGAAIGLFGFAVYLGSMLGRSR